MTNFNLRDSVAREFLIGYSLLGVDHRLNLSGRYSTRRNLNPDLSGRLIGSQQGVSLLRTKNLLRLEQLKLREQIKYTQLSYIENRHYLNNLDYRYFQKKYHF